MSFPNGRAWLRRFGIVFATVLGLGALTTASHPAAARVFVSFGVPFGYAYVPPAPPPPVYAYPTYYPYRPVWSWRHARWCRWHPYARSCHW